jgi:hypothetical protein
MLTSVLQLGIDMLTVVKKMDTVGFEPTTSCNVDTKMQSMRATPVPRAHTRSCDLMVPRKSHTIWPVSPSQNNGSLTQSVSGFRNELS